MPQFHWSTSVLCVPLQGMSLIAISLLVHYNYGNKKHVCPIGSSLKALRILATYKGQRDHVHLPSEKAGN